MGLQQQIDQDLVQAMKNREELRLSTLRMMKAALKNRQIELLRELQDAEAIQVLRTLIKQRRDSMEQYVRGGRRDLADKEAMEIGIIERYLPSMLGQEEVERVVNETIAQLGATSMKDMGPVMKATMEKFSTAVVDGKLVSQLVRTKLSQGS